MPVYQNATLPTFALPGLEHRTVGGPALGIKTMEVWYQTIEPGAGTPVHRHACEEVVVVLSGAGRLTVAGEDTDFGPDTTLIVPEDAVHQIVNTGPEPMVIVAVLGPSPVVVQTADGETIPLPWQSASGAVGS